MSDQIETTSSDALKAMGDLLALIVDAPACQRRFLELQQAEQRATRAQTKLATDRTKHDQTVAADRAVLEQERADLRKRQVALAAEEGRFQATREELSARLAEIDRNTGRYETFAEGTSVVREFVPGEPRDMPLRRAPVFQGGQS